MSEHRADIAWKRSSEDFHYERYNRDHCWRFDGGVVVPASASPDFRGCPDRVDPEEAFVASLSSCHMLTFLAVASRKRWVVDTYDDSAVGYMTKNGSGKLWVSRVVLRPSVKFSPDNQPSAEAVRHMHDVAHDNCFIALSVRSEVVVQAVDL